MLPKCNNLERPRSGSFSTQSFYTRHWGGQVVTYARILAMFAKIHLWTRRLERDPNAKNYTDQALRTSDDYDHQEMYQLTEAARQAGAKAKRIEEHKHARAHVAELTVEAVK